MRFIRTCFELTLVGAHSARVFAEQEAPPDGGTTETAEQFFGIADDVIEIDVALFERFVAAELQKLPGDIGGVVAGLLDFGQGDDIVSAGGAQHFLRVAEHDEEQIVEIVGETGGEAADSLHLVLLAGFVFTRLA